MISREEAFGLFSPGTYETFGVRLQELREALHKMLDACLAEGQELVGYGASATVTTVIHHLELGERLSFLVDDNPVKQGTVSPGVHLPVHSPKEIYRRGSRHVLVLPWRFADQILSKHSRFLDSAGQFYRFLPRLEIVGA